MAVDADRLLYRLTGNEIEDRCESEYVLHDGTRVIPVMGDSTQTPVVVRLHPPYTTRKASFRYMAAKIPPLIPPPGDTQPHQTASPGDTIPGDTYLGGFLIIPAPIQNANEDLVYEVAGSYNFLVTKDVRTYGKMRFDAHGYASFTDFLGHVQAKPGDPTWTNPYFDLNQLSSARILG